MAAISNERLQVCVLQCSLTLQNVWDYVCWEGKHWDDAIRVCGTDEGEGNLSIAHPSTVRNRETAFIWGEPSMSFVVNIPGPDCAGVSHFFVTRVCFHVCSSAISFRAQTFEQSIWLPAVNFLQIRFKAALDARTAPSQMFITSHLISESEGWHSKLWLRPASCIWMRKSPSRRAHSNALMRITAIIREKLLRSHNSRESRHK